MKISIVKQFVVLLIHFIDNYSYLNCLVVILFSPRSGSAYKSKAGSVSGYCRYTDCIKMDPNLDTVDI